MSANTVKSEPSPAPGRLLLIDGSPHPSGATAGMIGLALEAAPPRLLRERYRCFEQPPLPCDDCRLCYRRDRCSKRDLDEFYRRLEQSDYLLIATPVYNRSFPAPLKALIDRLQRYWSARFIRGVRPPIVRPRRVLLLTCAGSRDPRSGARLEEQLEPTLTVIHARLSGAVHVGGTDDGPLQPSDAARIRKAAERLFAN